MEIYNIFAFLSVISGTFLSNLCFIVHISLKLSLDYKTTYIITLNISLFIFSNIKHEINFLYIVSKSIYFFIIKSTLRNKNFIFYFFL